MQLKINKQVTDTPQVWFSSDFHLGHANIIQYCNRPFKDYREMDQAIISNCNELVAVDDTLFFLGDFCFYDKKRDEVTREELAELYRNQLNCQNIYFICGNHDKKLRDSERFRSLWKGVYDLLEIEVVDRKITLCHYPLRAWNASHHGSWSLFGHCHGGLEDDDSLSFDCGVDCFDFKPVSFDRVFKIMTRKYESKRK